MVKVELQAEPELIGGVNVHPRVNAEADAVLAVMIANDGESYSQKPMTLKSDGTPLSSLEVWRAWSLLAVDLACRDDLHPALKSICGMFDKLIQASGNPVLLTELEAAKKL